MKEPTSATEQKALQQIQSGLMRLGQETHGLRVYARGAADRIKELELEVAELRAALHDAPANGRCVRCGRRAKHSLCADCVRSTGAKRTALTGEAEK